MLKSILIVALAFGLLTVALAAQQSPITPQSTPNPVNSPEPLTMLALAGGALAAGGFAKRRRKDK